MEVPFSGGYGTCVVLTVTLDKAEHRAAHILLLTCKKQSHDITKSAGRNRGLEQLLFCPGDAGSRFIQNVGTPNVTNNCTSQKTVIFTLAVVRI